MGNILLECDGWTPVIDALAEELGLVTAVVYGVAWRYCQMSDHVCRASLETIGHHVHLDQRTVRRHMHALVEHGYLEDLTPDLRHAPHTYRDSGKARIGGLVQARVDARGRTADPTYTKVGQRVLPGRTDDPTKKLEDSRQETRKKADGGAQARSGADAASLVAPPEPAASPPASRKEPKSRKPPNIAPEIILLRQITGYLPDKQKFDWERLIRLVQSATPERLRKYFAVWVSEPRHFSRVNFGWLDWVEAGHIPDYHPNGNGKSKLTFGGRHVATPEEMDDDYVREVNRRMNAHLYAEEGT